MTIFPGREFFKFLETPGRVVAQNITEFFEGIFQPNWRQRLLEQAVHDARPTMPENYSPAADAVRTRGTHLPHFKQPRGFARTAALAKQGLSHIPCVRCVQLSRTVSSGTLAGNNTLW